MILDDGGETMGSLINDLIWNRISPLNENILWSIISEMIAIFNDIS